MKKQVARLAERLLALLPSDISPDWEDIPAAVWRPSVIGAGLVPHVEVDSIELDDLLQIDRQKAALDQNIRQFLAGLPANNALLWGSRGTGKSSLVHALLNAHRGEGLRLVEVDKHQLHDLPDLVEQLRQQPFRFVVFCDDLSFEAGDPGYKALKSALEGSVFTTSSNVLIVATSNRRHLLPEYLTDNDDARLDAEGELHQGELVEEKISLSDRFGLWLSFYPFKQDAYLDVARHWVDKLSAEYGLEGGFGDEARAHALRFALARGVRSGRTAQHFARHWVGERLLAQQRQS